MDRSTGYTFTPIGVVKCSQKYRFESPRQGVFGSQDGRIELLPSYGGDAIADLAGFSRIWVIFCFHLNCDRPWKAKVKVPFPADSPCRSLFATRSPYRVNPIGLSCVEVDRIEKNCIYLKNIDMLDGTPVLDIKPYIPEADAFPEAAAGWRDESVADKKDNGKWTVDFSGLFLKQADFIMEISGLDLKNFCEIQLSSEPLDFSRKRLTDCQNNEFLLGCRTWKIRFAAESAAQQIKVLEVRSNYRSEELAENSEDRYNDKKYHRLFNEAKSKFFEKEGILI